MCSYGMKKHEMTLICICKVLMYTVICKPESVLHAFVISKIRYGILSKVCYLLSSMAFANLQI